MAQDQLQDIVSRMLAAGESEEDIAAVIRAFTPVPSHGGEAEARPIATGGGRGTGLDVRKSNKWARDNAPVIGATLATTATGGGALPLILSAAGGGTAGSMLRGDDIETALTEGAIQGGTQAAGMGLVKATGAVARGLMKGTVPKNIAKDFDNVDIPQEMLNRNVLPGYKPSQARVAAQSAAANAERDAAARTVPRMTPARALRDIRPIYQGARAGKKLDMSADALEFAKKSRAEMGTGLDGPGQLARKDILQSEARAALNAGNPRQAALTPQLADAERSAIVSHLRETPRMATALDESQALMAIDQVMRDAALANPVTRARIGGPTAASLSPIGLGATAHAVNAGRMAVSPQMLRAIQMAILSGQQE